MFRNSIILNFAITAGFFIGNYAGSADEISVLGVKNSTKTITAELAQNQSVLTGSSLAKQKQNFLVRKNAIDIVPQIFIADPSYLKLTFRQYQNLLQLAADAADLPDDLTPGWAQNLVEQTIPSFNNFSYPKFADDPYLRVTVARESLIEIAGKNAVVAIEKSLSRRKRPVQINCL